MAYPPETLAGPRVRLRRSWPDDFAVVYPVVIDPEVMRYMEWPMPGSEDDTRAFFAGVVERWESGIEYHWMIERLADGAFLGCIGCRARGDSADFGYFLARGAWGQGFMTEAASLVVDWLRQQQEITRVWSTTDVENARSQRVLAKVGLVVESVIPAAGVRPQIGGAPRAKWVHVLAEHLPRVADA